MTLFSVFTCFQKNVIQNSQAHTYTTANIHTLHSTTDDNTDDEQTKERNWKWIKKNIYSFESVKAERMNPYNVAFGWYCGMNFSLDGSHVSIIATKDITGPPNIFFLML